MKHDEILKRLGELNASKVKFAASDIDGILRGKTVRLEKFLLIAKEGGSFCDVVFGWDANDACYDNVKSTGWHTGYPDAPLQIDLSTFRRIPWDNDIPFFIADYTVSEGNHFVACPRSLLKRIAKQAEKSGFLPQFSEEIEWFNFKNTPWELEESGYKNLRPLTPGMFGYSMLRPAVHSDYFNSLFDLLERFDIPLEGLHTETGPGVFEAAISYNEVVSAADRAILFKNSVKEIAYQYGLIASFMAKWNSQLPGCGGHIHQSLWDIAGNRNLFFDEKDSLQMSEIMKQYLAGQLYCLPYIMPMYAPTVNSYKRLGGGAWAPVTVSWGIDNRTVAIRVININEASIRCEMRVPGADVNPYLAMAAGLASGLYGIKNKMDLKLPATRGNGYEATTQGMLPMNLQEATSLMKNSELAVELFGKEFTDHFISTREWEWRQFSKEVTNWELKRYFEII